MSVIKINNNLVQYFQRIKTDAKKIHDEKTVRIVNRPDLTLRVSPSPGPGWVGRARTRDPVPILGVGIREGGMLLPACQEL